jgi:uncharacterized protein (DUF3820 family)
MDVGGEDSGVVRPNPAALEELVSYRMPFGKYRGRLLLDLPEPYLCWFARTGFPDGKLGRMLQSMHEIKVNGLERLLDPLRPRDG